MIGSPGVGPGLETEGSLRLGRSAREGGAWLLRKGRALATEPRYRRLRWVLLAGLAIRLVLAPLSSWGIDTPYFTLSAARMLQTGSPYGGDTFFNGPFGPVAELPGFALASLFAAPSSFVQYVPALLPVAVRTQIVIPYLPTPAALLLLKLPMIASDALVTLLVYHAVRLHAGGAVGTAAAAAWFLNPLVFWVSAVHGEVDTFAALFVLASLHALERRLAFATGVLLGLGTFAKVYPALLVPLAVAVLMADAARGTPLKDRLAPVARLAAGLAVSAAPFLLLLSGLSVVLAHQAGNVNFGGLSLLIVFNPNITSIARLWPAGTSAVVVAILEGTLVVGVIGSVFAVGYRYYRPGPPSVPELPWLATLGVATVAGSLLAILTTQAENIVAVLPLLLLAAPLLRRWGRRLYWTLSLAAFAEYLALLTPVAFFYPLWTLVGPGAVRWASGVVLPYALDQTPVAAGAFWIVLGVLGGLALVAIWGVAARSVWRELRGKSASLGPTSGEPSGLVRRGRPPANARARVTVSLGAVLIVALLAVEVGATAAAVAPPRSTLQVSLVSVAPVPDGVATTLRLTAGTTPLDVHVGVLPGTERPRGPVYVYADAAYPDPNGSYTTTVEIAERVSLALAGSGHGTTVTTVDAQGVPGLLTPGSPGTLVVLGGLVPDTVLSNTTDLLAPWIAGGGTLVWAGGLLGGAEGHASAGGFVSDSLGAQGQLDLVHFPLSDPSGPGPLLSDVAGPLAAAMGTTYNGTPSGANTTALRAHGGVDLGWDSPVGAIGEAARSSLVYVPVGSGGVFYFGGSVWASKHPPVDFPAANLALADDLAVLLASGYDPSPGPSAFANVHLDPRESVTLRLTVSNGAAPAGLVAVVSTPVVPTFLSFWSERLVAAPS